ALVLLLAHSLDLGAHFLEERGGRNAPLLLDLDQFARTVPLRDGLCHELAPRPVALLELNGGTPRLLPNGFQRHLECRPFRIAKAFQERRVVIHPPDAVALQQRGLRLRLSAKRDDLGTVFLSHDLVVPGTLDRADLLILQLLPGLECGLLDRKYV